jgi:hypothetical protein
MDFNSIDEAVASAKSATDEKVSELVDATALDLTKTYPQPDFMLTRHTVGTLPLGDIQAIKAKSKNGKSYLCSILMASLLGCKDFEFESKGGSPLVLYFDTEQNERNTAVLIRRVHALCGWSVTDNNYKSLVAYPLRSMAADEKLNFIVNAITLKQPTVVFIDGIADLVSNFNDVEQSTITVNRLMKLSADCNCSIVCVLHTNKAKDDSNMKGHLGTMLLQKSSDVFDVSKSSDVFNVQETDCRNMPIDDFAFCIDDNGMPHSTATLKENRKAERDAERLESLRGILRKCFDSVETLDKKVLLAKIETFSGITTKQARRNLQEALAKGLLTVADNDTYKL